MKKLFLLALATVLCTACQEKPASRYTQQSPEIEMVKTLIKNYNNKVYETSVFADTSKTYFNTKDNPIPSSEALEYHKANDVNYSSRGFLPEDQEYEMVVTDDGETWVNSWLDWKGTLAANNKEITFPVHLTYQFIDGQVVREIGLWDPTEVVLALQEIEANNNRSADAKAIQTSIDNVEKAWNTNDKDLMYAHMVGNIIRTANGATIAQKHSDYGDFVDIYHSAFPDFKVTLDHIKIDGNMAYILWTCTGTNKGEFMGNPPTNKQIETQGFSIWKFDAEGKATREDAFYDNLVVYQQLGYSMPTPIE